jgi:hypothetical protein
MFSCTKDEKRSLSKKEQAIAINYAMRLELSGYPRPVLIELAQKLKRANSQDVNALLEFWKNTSVMTKRAYVAVLYFM